LSYSRAKAEVTQEKFAKFLEWLSPDPARAGEEYERLRLRLFNFFSQRNCGFVDELADETINRVMAKVSEERIESKIAYCYGVAKNIYRETLRKQRSHVDIDDVTIAAAEPYEPSIPSECLDKCLEELPFDCRKLLLDYFSGSPQEKIALHLQIATRMKMTQTALRMRVYRCKEKLRCCVEECMA
jgi:DNA-directed RNA polymerase specialized sigma24 family protein